MSGNSSFFTGSEVLEFHESAIEANRFSVNIKGRGWLMSILHNGQQLVEVQRENLRRMIACWNACAGIDTDLLEGFSPNFLASYPDRVLVERQVLQMQVTQLLNHLVQVIEGAGYSVSGPTDSEDAANGDPDWLCNARAEIDNAMERFGNQMAFDKLAARRSQST